MRFLLDGMLGSLARWLRIMGHDVLYIRNLGDRDLINLSISDGRILLTSDIALYRMAIAKGAESFLIKGRTEAERLADLAKRYEMKLEVDVAMSRCPICGSTLTRTPKETIKGKVPASTFRAFDEFWTCSNLRCGKIYWRGSHWKNIYHVLKDAKRLSAKVR